MNKMNITNILNNKSETTEFDTYVTPPLSTISAIALAQLTIILLIGTGGNLIVIYVFGWKKRKRRRSFDLLLLILGITDCFASFIVPSLFIYGTWTQLQQWHFGYYGCKIIHSIFPMSITISQGILVLISYERCKVIRDPFRGRMTKTKIYLWLGFILVISFGMVSPYTYSLELVVDRAYRINTCTPAGGDPIVLFIFSITNCTRDFAATCVLITFGILSHKTLKEGSLVLGKASRIKRRYKNATKARKMLIIVTCVFCICVIPLDVFQLVVYTLFQATVPLTDEAYQVIIKTNTFLTVLQITNSATNIFIYSKMHQDFTKNLFLCASASKTFIRSSMNRFSTTVSFRDSSISDIDEFEVNNSVFI